MNTGETPQIYVACLASYNNGVLFGEWIDVDQEVETVREQIQALLARSPHPGAEEYAIHDTNNFGPIDVGEYEDLEAVCEAATFIAKHPETGPEILNYFGGLSGLEEARDALENQYAGLWKHTEDWAEDWLKETGDWEQVPKSLRPYIDLEAYVRDQEISGCIFTVSTPRGVHIFRSA